jgi:hypothetical protein
MEAPALRDFNAIQGNIASKFSGMGGAGSLSSRRSSGFQNTMNQAGSDFAQDLQSRRVALSQQALKDLHSMSQDLLNDRPYDLVQKPEKKKSGWPSIAGAAIGGAGGFFGSGGNPAMGFAGAKTGFDIGSAF